MDLIDYSQEKYDQIKGEIEYLASKSQYKDQTIHFIPISALKGDNVVFKSENMSWYSGASLLDHLENINTDDIQDSSQVRFPVQTVIRPKTEEFHDFRGYAGKIYGGNLSVGDELIVLPSMTRSKIKEIQFFHQKFQTAESGSSVTLILEDDVNISRGDMLVKVGEQPQISKQISATVCWMDSSPLRAASRYYLKHGVNDVQAKIMDISAIIHTDYSGAQENPAELRLNEIGKVELKVSKPIFVDSYKVNKENGAFILIDARTNSTAGVGFIN